MPILLLLMLAGAPDQDRADQAEDAAFDAKARAAPQLVQAVLSVHVCDAKDEERQALAEIAEEKANAKIAGVVRLDYLRGYQDTVVAKRKEAAAYVAELQAQHLKPLGCGSEMVRIVRLCASEPSNGDCRRPEFQAITRLLDSTTLAASEP